MISFYFYFHEILFLVFVDIIIFFCEGEKNRTICKKMTDFIVSQDHWLWKVYFAIAKCLVAFVNSKSVEALKTWSIQTRDRRQVHLVPFQKAILVFFFIDSSLNVLKSWFAAPHLLIWGFSKGTKAKPFLSKDCQAQIQLSPPNTCFRYWIIFNFQTNFTKQLIILETKLIVVAATWVS